MSWRSIYISEAAKLSTNLDSLVIYKFNGDEIKIPFNDIDSILLEDVKTVVTIKTLNKIVEYKILFLICDEKHNPNLYIMPSNGYYKQLQSIENQIMWNKTLEEEVWNIIVKEKIRNQIKLLEKYYLSEKIEKMKSLLSNVKCGDVKNQEGIAARIYFKEFFGDYFIRGGNDAINSALNYGYTILNSSISRAIAVRGYLPYLGINHSNKFNKFNLSSDLIEPFRIIIDEWVINNMLYKDVLERADRIRLVNLLNSKIKYKNKKCILINVIDSYVEEILNILNEDKKLEINFPDILTVEENEV